MFMYLNKKRQKGQSTLEYAILIVIIIGALMTIQLYIRRGIQGRLKSATDDIGIQFTPGNTKVNWERETHGKTSETFKAGVTKSMLLEKEESTDKLQSDIMIVNQEFWGK